MKDMEEYNGLDFHSKENTLEVHLYGHWLLSKTQPSPLVLLAYLEHDTSFKKLSFNTKNLISWDSTLPAFLLEFIQLALKHHLTIEETHLPQGVQRLLHLAREIPSSAMIHPPEVLPSSLITSIRMVFLNLFHIVDEIFIFLGDFYRALLRFFLGKSSYLIRDFFSLIQENGVFSLLMVSVISFLLGVIFAFIEATQLKIVSAQLFLANFMAISIVREISPLMTGIFMAGRTGAAYAAYLGMMQFNDEVDALKTAHISPVDFLVVPRILTLTFIMPCLYIYSILFAILGSASLDLGLLGITIPEYLTRVLHSIRPFDLCLGFFKSAIFGFLIALWGCFYGMRIKSLNISLGDATRNAVVMGILSIITMDALLGAIFYWIGGGGQ